MATFARAQLQNNQLLAIDNINFSQSLCEYS